MSDEPLKICPHGGGALRRIVNTGSGIIFKGSGFYATDYKSNGPKCWRSGSK
jgi:predicted nucleic acid-binding Zn ribbon protein